MHMTPGEFTEFLKKDIEKWAKVVAVAGLKPQ
jgi:tripartite-type tricarboxylate transporter receptor subunit TctC